MSLACWVGIPVCLVLIVILNYNRLKYQSMEPLSPLLAGLESQLPSVHITLKISYELHRATTISKKTGNNRKIFIKKKQNLKAYKRFVL